ncbi:multiple sugar transport system substrate-binding protein [Microbacterium halimionae]|uniref:Multiple sugar transport system substrate-binding protein n=1 Tax=Microbacterium halimionae TaxID=1526413 RepID=A0A7W3JM43_9MICO|nr:extracellular solute-binding protein [Microbacterium halimionae]MBA8815326.1 multiple sugar transport system substrate-binding protein [Microbacterium halimionae]NII93883.1 multiple sugar transport system substrate-binding protein [Microbacterium halimionae]
MITKKLRAPLALITAAVAVGALAGCSGGGSDDASGSASGDTYTWWDPYPQHEAGSDWDARVQACGTDAGVTIERTAYDTTSLTNSALLAAQEGTSPDVILLDNPAVSTLADTGMLTTMDELGLDVSDVDENLLAAGQIDGATYGIPIGANTLALYYNADVLSAAGVDPASITDWDSLTTALEAVNASGKTGITFAGINTEEGSFQFLPWFWGAGADLTELNSPDAVAALDLWTGWLNDGLAPNSVIGNSQNTTWEEFLTGEFGFVENGTWQVNSAADAGFETGIITIPARDGGAAPAPTGGEFIIAPVQSDTARYDTTRQIIECMTTPEGFVETANTFAYYIPPTADGQEQLLEENPDLSTWVEAVQAAKGRTSDNLGTDYPLISEQLWTAVQSALSGAQTPQEALDAAQDAAAAATGN